MKIEMTPEASADLHGIKDYIEQELGNPVAALNTVARITKAIRGLLTFPDSGTPLSPIVNFPTNYRFLVSGSYLVFYLHTGNIAQIIRILYGKRDYLRILFGEIQGEG